MCTDISLLQPPPTLRVTGPLLPSLNNVTLSAHPNPDPTTGRVTFSSQSHRFASGNEEPEQEQNYYSARSKKDERDEKKRQMREAAYKTGWGNTLPWERNRDAVRDRVELEDGIAFPGLWISEESGKNKEFRLDLTIGPPGEDQAPAAEMNDATLRNVLNGTDMAPLMNLNEAESSTPIEGIEQNEAIDTSLEKNEAAETEQPAPAAPQPWATFSSDPLTIVSKPSQKTAKARSMASCLSARDAFALYVRVNGQTVRTKYLKLDNEDAQPQLAARVGKWSPFRFEIVQTALPPRLDDKEPRPRFKLDADREASIITYGSIVRIVDVQSDTRSDPMRLVRVDKNEVVVGADEGHPVSELQRVGLVRVVDGADDLTGGGRWYLSAPGAVAGAGEVSTTRARPDAKAAKVPSPETLGGAEGIESGEKTPRRRKKTKRHALARAAIEEEEQGSNRAGLIWHRAERREGEHVVTEGKVSTTRQATIETVDDWMCWVLTGVCEYGSGSLLTSGCFSYSFFNGLGDSGSLPSVSLDPVPRLLVDPVFRPEHNALNLTLSYFYVPDASGQSLPMSVYLGPIGPLKVSTWRSVAPKEKYYDPGALYPAVPYSGNPEDHSDIPEERRVLSNYPFSANHVIAMVELPEMAEVARAMREYGSKDEEEPQQPPPQAQRENEGEDVWLGMGAEGELTIQEALRNANKENGEDILRPTEGKDEFSLEQLPEHLIDPMLESQQQAENASEHQETHPSQPQPPAPTTITMHRAQERPSKDGTPLPLLLVRPDGVGHGIGWSVVLRHMHGGTDDSGEGICHFAHGQCQNADMKDLGLGVVQTSARGQSLAW